MLQELRDVINSPLHDLGFIHVATMMVLYETGHSGSCPNGRGISSSLRRFAAKSQLRVDVERLL